MDAAVELGRNPVSKHHIQPEYGDEQADARGSMIGEGEDTTISSPGRSPKQPLPEMGQRDPLYGRQAWGWSNMSPEGAIFVLFPLKRGTNLLHALPPNR